MTDEPHRPDWLRELSEDQLKAFQEHFCAAAAAVSAVEDEHALGQLELSIGAPDPQGATSAWRGFAEVLRRREALDREAAKHVAAIVSLLEAQFGSV